MTHLSRGIIERPWIALIGSLLAGVLVFVCVYLLIDRLENQGERSQLQALSSDLRSLRSEFSGLINQSIHLTYGIQAYVSVIGGGDIATFTKLADELLGHSEYLKNISLIKGSELIAVHPLKGNKNALGLRFDKVQRNGFNKAIEHKKTVLVGPISLVQGGEGLIVRTPIYLADGRYWGQTSAVLDWNKLVSHVGLKRYSERSNLSIHTIDLVDQSVSLVWGRELENVSTDVFVEEIDLPLSIWKLRATPINVFVLPFKNTLILCALAISFAITTLIFKYLEQFRDLTKQKQIAEELSFSRGQLLLSTVHDLRQPINALGIAVNQAGQSCDPVYIQHAQQCLKAINQFFDQLSNFEQLETGKIVATRTRFSVAELLIELEREMKLIPEQKGIQLDLVILEDQSNQIVLSDQTLLNRIIRNLIVNAINHTHQGTVTIQLRTTGDNKKIYQEVRVFDTGVGMDKKSLARATEAFYQVPSDQPQSGKGLGLGLDIVRRLSDLLGIGFSIKSELRVGTVVTLTIPSGGIETSVADHPLQLGVHLIEEVAIPSELLGKFESWGVRWGGEETTDLNLVISEGGDVGSWKSVSRPTLILSYSAVKNTRYSASVWLMSITQPVAAIRRTLFRIAQECDPKIS